MDNILKTGLFALLICTMFLTACGDDNVVTPTPPVITTPETPTPVENNDMYELEDQAARPAIAATFVNTEDKDTWNLTSPSEKGAAFSEKFNSRLLALNPGYTTNLLGLDSETFTGILANDVLTVSTVGTTTYYDGTNVLTGRNLSDDVINVSLTLVFGGPDGSELPGLSNDNVSENDKPFLTAFPYMAAPH